jgi:hypothetical protein
MEITFGSPVARATYDKYMNKTSQLRKFDNAPPSRILNPTAVQYLNAIFESAAGLDGELSEAEAEVVKNFLETSGIDIAETNSASPAITSTEARILAENKWVPYALGPSGLSSITTSADIESGFQRIFTDAEAAVNSRDRDEFACVGIKTAVFFGRIAKGKNSLGNGTLSLVRNKANELMELKCLDRNFGMMMMLGMFCIDLLKNTAATAEEGEALVDAFVAAFFPRHPEVRKCSSCQK